MPNKNLPRSINQICLTVAPAKTTVWLLKPVTWNKNNSDLPLKEESIYTCNFANCLRRFLINSRIRLFPVACLKYGRHGLCYRRHFRGASKIIWEKQKCVTFRFSCFYFEPHTAFSCKSGSIHCLHLYRCVGKTVLLWNNTTLGRCITAITFIFLQDLVRLTLQTTLSQSEFRDPTWKSAAPLCLLCNQRCEPLGGVLQGDR